MRRTDLEQAVRVLNKRTGNPMEMFENEIIQKGHFYIASAYGGVKLEQINQNGGCRDISRNGYQKAKDLHLFISGMLAAIELSE